MKMIDYNLLKGKITAMQSTEPEYAFNFLNNAQNPSTEWECIEDMLDNMEVYEAEPVKHGQWIPQGDDMWLCSNCKENIIYSMHKSDRAKKQRYCSRCGARMDIVYQDEKVTATKVTGW